MDKSENTKKTSTSTTTTKISDLNNEIVFETEWYRLTFNNEGFKI